MCLHPTPRVTCLRIYPKDGKEICSLDTECRNQRVPWSVKKSMPQLPAKGKGQVLNREAKQKGYTG